MTPTLLRAVERLRALPPAEQDRQGRHILDVLDAGRAHTWLDVLADARVEGPPDWSENVNDYLTGVRTLNGAGDPSPDDGA